MTVLERDDLLMRSFGSRFVETGVAAGSDRLREEHEKAWRNVVDDKLIGWGHCPEQFDAENPGPSREIVSLAAQIASQFGSFGWPPPSSVRVDADGGIILERSCGDLKEVIHVWEDCSVEYQLFKTGQLVERLQLNDK